MSLIELILTDCQSEILLHHSDIPILNSRHRKPNHLERQASRFLWAFLPWLLKICCQSCHRHGRVFNSFEIVTEQVGTWSVHRYTWKNNNYKLPCVKFLVLSYTTALQKYVLIGLHISEIYLWDFMSIILWLIEPRNNNCDVKGQIILEFLLVHQNRYAEQQTDFKISTKEKMEPEIEYAELKRNIHLYLFCLYFTLIWLRR